MGCFALIAVAACEDTAGPNRTPSLAADVVPVGGTLSATATLSNDLVVAGSPITYTVNLGTTFSSASEVDYFFTFGDDPLDPGECLDFTIESPTGAGTGFCNGGTTPQTSRLLTFPCASFPNDCDPLRDGLTFGQIVVSTFPASGGA